MSTPPQRLLVYLYDRLAGEITRQGGSLTFQYTAEYIVGRDPTPLSLSMPLAETPYPRRRIEAFLKGLLPDHADVRRRWAERFGLKLGDTFGLIAAIGSDAAGGAVFVPPDDDPAMIHRSGSLEPVSEDDIAQRLRGLREDSTAWLADDEHWSLAGAQSKFTLRRTAAGWAVAHGREPSTHIVKPGITRLPGQALTEHVTMRTARQLGLDVAETEYLEFVDQPAIVIARFDRLLRNDRLIRMHQEDFCQVFGLDPSRKYEADGGPGVQRIADALRATARDDSVERFARSVIVNYLLGAPDAHSKNYSVLLIGSSVRLGPLYDVASGLAATRGDTLSFPAGAMSIGGARAFGEVGTRNWDRFATACNLPADHVREWVREYATAVPDALRDAVSAVPGAYAGRSLLTDSLLPRVAHLARLTLDQLDSPQSGRGPAKGSKAREIAAAT